MSVIGSIAGAGCLFGGDQFVESEILVPFSGSDTGLCHRCEADFLQVSGKETGFFSRKGSREKRLHYDDRFTVRNPWLAPSAQTGSFELVARFSLQILHVGLIE